MSAGYRRIAVTLTEAGTVWRLPFIKPTDNLIDARRNTGRNGTLAQNSAEDLCFRLQYSDDDCSPINIRRVPADGYTVGILRNAGHTGKATIYLL